MRAVHVTGTSCCGNRTWKNYHQDKFFERFVSFKNSSKYIYGLSSFRQIGYTLMAWLLLFLHREGFFLCRVINKGVLMSKQVAKAILQMKCAQKTRKIQCRFVNSTSKIVFITLFLCKNTDNGLID